VNAFGPRADLDRFITSSRVSVRAGNGHALLGVNFFEERLDEALILIQQDVWWFWKRNDLVACSVQLIGEHSHVHLPVRISGRQSSASFTRGLPPVSDLTLNVQLIEII